LLLVARSHHKAPAEYREEYAEGYSEDHLLAQYRGWGGAYDYGDEEGGEEEEEEEDEEEKQLGLEG
jgi:hypothetical protein